MSSLVVRIILSFMFIFSLIALLVFMITNSRLSRIFLIGCVTILALLIAIFIFHWGVPVMLGIVILTFAYVLGIFGNH